MSQVQVVSMPGNWTHLWLSGYNLLSIWSLKNYTVVSKYGMVCRTLK